MSSSYLSCNFKPQCSKSTHRVLCSNPLSNFALVLKQNDQLCFQTQSLRLQWKCIKNRRNFAVRATSSAPPDDDLEVEQPLPSTRPMSSDPFTNQILIAMVQMVMSYLKETFGPVWIFKDRVDDAIQRVEDIADAVEEAAERVDKVADDILDDLPEGRLKDLVNYIEDLAEVTAHRADSVGDFIDEVQEEGDKLEEFVKSVDDRVDGYLAKGTRQNNLFEALFVNLLPSLETFSYF